MKLYYWNRTTGLATLVDHPSAIKNESYQSSINSRQASKQASRRPECEADRDMLYLPQMENVPTHLYPLSMYSRTDSTCTITLRPVKAMCE